MPKSARDWVLDTATVLAAGCAVVVTSLFVWDRVARSSSLGAIDPVAIESWEDNWADGQRIGAEDAPVVIVEYGDYQCPVCRSLHGELKGLSDRYGDAVALIYRHWPLSQHPGAYPAARAAECAARQSRFEPFHEILYTESDWYAGQATSFVEYAERVAIEDLQAFEECVSSSEPVAAIENAIADVRALGGRGTPTILVNELFYPSAPSIEQIEARVREVLAGTSEGG